MRQALPAVSLLVLSLLAACGGADAPAPTPGSPSTTASPPPLPSVTTAEDPAGPTSPAPDPRIAVLADWLLGNQDSGGALQDDRGGDVCNEDSNMEYALAGLGAAFSATGDPRYLAALERGIRWLAARQEMADGPWRGSWFYVYACRPPYAPVATSPGAGVTDVRGVDSTGALFVYLLWLHARLSGSDALAQELSSNARGALDFVLDRDLDANGFTFSSWQLSGGAWRLWRYQYAADQADVLLGLRAGGLLFGSSGQRYAAAADRIAQGLAARFFDAGAGRFSEGLDEDGDLDFSEEFDGIFPQGYIPWVLGPSAQAIAAYQWLARGVQSDGRVVLFNGDPGYSLTADVLSLAASRLGAPRPATSLDWLFSNTYVAATGAVQDTAERGSDETSNVVGFTILALVGKGPFELGP